MRRSFPDSVAGTVPRSGATTCRQGRRNRHGPERATPPPVFQSGVHSFIRSTAVDSRAGRSLLVNPERLARSRFGENHRIDRPSNVKQLEAKRFFEPPHHCQPPPAVTVFSSSTARHSCGAPRPLSNALSSGIQWWSLLMRCRKSFSISSPQIISLAATGSTSIFLHGTIDSVFSQQFSNT